MTALGHHAQAPDTASWSFRACNEGFSWGWQNAAVRLDQIEHVRAGPSLHLAQEAALVGAQVGDLVDQGQPVGQEGLVEVELAAANHVAVLVPAVPTAP